MKLFDRMDKVLRTSYLLLHLMPEDFASERELVSVGVLPLSKRLLPLPFIQFALLPRSTGTR